MAWLYVFHTIVCAFTKRWLPPFSHAPLWTATMDAITLTMKTGIAILPYEYFGLNLLLKLAVQRW